MKLAYILTAALTVSSALAGAKPIQQPPNILFIFSDDHSTQAIGAYNGRMAPLNPTPNIDRLAQEGAIFRESFCANSICQPSRATVLTGKHSHLNGVTYNGAKWDGSQTIFPRLLKEQAGYQTALIGKWHLKPDPVDEFDYWMVLASSGGQGDYFNPNFNTINGPETLMGYSTDVITDRSIQWLENRDQEKPFLLMCQFKSPHVPQLPPIRNAEMYKDQDLPEPETLLDNYKNRQPYLSKHWMGLDTAKLAMIPPKGTDYPQDNEHKKALKRMTPEQVEAWHKAYDEQVQAYYDFMHSKASQDPVRLQRFKYQTMLKSYLRCVAAVDQNVGRLLQWLEDNDLENDTIVIYSSDQSYYIGEHGMADKRWMYEESLRMPLVVRWPGKIKPGTEVSELVQNIDYAPTLLSAAGLEAPPEMQGQSLLPLLAEGQNSHWRQTIYYHYYTNGEHNVPRHDGVRDSRYKLIHYYTDDTCELFDIQNDPNEVKSLHNNPEYSTVVERMKKKLAAQRKENAVPDSAFEAPYIHTGKLHR
ncbi:Choline-sulfatase [Pontiella desulfatans]|uniref:Choline-sulfatase n=1 Tax=Pontiella desulfatans TaxID=2750659 RepID=A0A6C2TY59_PONDE|nr:sulfatase [Pontiella desulfatans]SPS73681.1 sulfatase S1_11 [Kiritimatiellales bacterium]VGO12572.1 Choline-sulfatase [Pontiella desulfatans]